MRHLNSEECFGPIAGIYRVDSQKKPLPVANNCEYGWPRAIFTNRSHLAKDMARRIGIRQLPHQFITVKTILPCLLVAQVERLGRFG